MFIVFTILLVMNALTEYLFNKMLFSLRVIERKYTLFHSVTALLRILWVAATSWFSFPLPIVLIGLFILLAFNTIPYRRISFLMNNFTMIIYLIFITILMMIIACLGLVGINIAKLMEDSLIRIITVNVAFGIFNGICFMFLHYYPEFLWQENNDRLKVVLYTWFLFICSVYQVLDSTVVSMYVVSQTTYLLLISGDVLILILMFNLLNYNFVFARSEKMKQEFEENEVLIAQQFFEKEALKRMSEYDSLTNAYNRREISAIMQEGILSENKMVCVFIDLDGLKKINDHYGHINGDMMLKKFANACVEMLNDTGKLARIGGDEFLLVYFDKSVEEVERYISTLQLKLSESEAEKDKIYFSYGISYNEKTVEDYIAKADECMYRDKVRKQNGDVLC